MMGRRQRIGFLVARVNSTLEMVKLAPTCVWVHATPVPASGAAG
jgi:hypothetical protein